MYWFDKISSMKSFGQCLMINLGIIPHIDVSGGFTSIKLCVVPLGKTAVIF